MRGLRSARKARVVFLSALALLAARPAPQSRWSTAARLPEPLLDAHAATLDGKIYVAGGLDSAGRPTRHAYRYDPSTDRWERISDLPAPRHGMPLVVWGDTLYALGGFSGRELRAERTMWTYRADRDLWVDRPQLPAPRGAGAATVVDDLIVLVGGLMRFSDGGLVAACAVYEPKVHAWIEVWPLPTLRDHLTAQAVDGIVYVIGGRLLSAAQNYDVVEAYHPRLLAGGRWSGRDAMPIPIGDLASVVINRKIHTFGGETPNEVLDKHEVYDPARDSWSEAEPLPTPRHGVAAATVNGRVFVIGGSPKPGIAATDIVEVYTP